MMSQRDRAPSRERPKVRTPREDGVLCAKASTATSNAPRWPVAVRIAPITTGKSATRARRDGRRRLDQDRDVEMVLQEIAGFDGLLAAAIDENDAFAFQADDGRVRQGFVCRRQKRGHLRSRLGGVARPAGRLADIDILNGSGAPESCRRLDEARGFLRATDRQRRVLAGNRLEPVDLRPAELARGRNRAAVDNRDAPPRRQEASCLRTSRSVYS